MCTVTRTRHTHDEPPLSSHYPQRVEAPELVADGPEDVVHDDCSRLAYADASLAAPFMGLAAGALLAAGLAQHALGMTAPTNYFKNDLLGLLKWSTRRPA